MALPPMRLVVVVETTAKACPSRNGGQAQGIRDQLPGGGWGSRKGALHFSECRGNMAILGLLLVHVCQCFDRKGSWGFPAGFSRAASIPQPAGVQFAPS